VRNKSGGDSAKSMTIIRAYVMERFLERMSLSAYKKNLILKGGVLVSSIVGIANRTTMDVDATLKGLPLSQEDIRGIVNDISSVPLDDGMSFSISDDDMRIGEGRVSAT
jgi:hypothetical protein